MVVDYVPHVISLVLPPPAGSTTPVSPPSSNSGTAFLSVLRSGGFGPAASRSILSIPSTVWQLADGQLTYSRLSYVYPDVSVYLHLHLCLCNLTIFLCVYLYLSPFPLSFQSLSLSISIYISNPSLFSPSNYFYIDVLSNATTTNSLSMLRYSSD